MWNILPLSMVYLPRGPQVRATIQVEEIHGLFSKSWKVTCRVDLTDIERSAIRHAKLENKLLYVTGRDPGRDTTLGQFIAAGCVVTQTFPTMDAAAKDQRFQEQQLLPKLKDLVDLATGFQVGTKTIEF